MRNPSFVALFGLVFIIGCVAANRHHRRHFLNQDGDREDCECIEERSIHSRNRLLPPTSHFEDCTCITRRRLGSRVIRLPTGHHRLRVRKRRAESDGKAAARMDSWLATSYEEDDNKERHWTVPAHALPVPPAKPTPTGGTTKKSIKKKPKTTKSSRLRRALSLIE
ncbi:unnamed protein product, partial [Mesorhabditis spiculigera]